ncbi:TetR family transcriptional regulator [Streptomyces sp. NPDC046977]|uniref:TetR/AcrR family transcriptional regulator n=1 Tax=Streptomyces sp. NPDC046977 TaxID=3154703 RepID=UPI0033C55AD3
MVKKSDVTKRRILDAASQEFARYGIAGARVDRIAADASVNKNLLYVYFGNKIGLFEVVYEQAIGELLEAVPFDADDLPGYAGALFDFYQQRPHLLRLARWFALEGAVELSAAPGLESTIEKATALAAAQAAGKVDAGMSSAAMLALILNIAATWSDGSPEGTAGPGGDDVQATRRRAIMLVVSRLTTPQSA